MHFVLEGRFTPYKGRVGLASDWAWFHHVTRSAYSFLFPSRAASEDVLSLSFWRVRLSGTFVCTKCPVFTFGPVGRRLSRPRSILVYIPANVTVPVGLDLAVIKRVWCSDPIVRGHVSSRS